MTRQEEANRRFSTRCAHVLIMREIRRASYRYVKHGRTFVKQPDRDSLRLVYSSLLLRVSRNLSLLNFPLIIAFLWKKERKTRKRSIDLWGSNCYIVTRYNRIIFLRGFVPFLPYPRTIQYILDLDKGESFWQTNYSFCKMLRSLFMVVHSFRGNINKEKRKSYKFEWKLTKCRKGSTIFLANSPWN